MRKLILACCSRQAVGRGDGTSCRLHRRICQLRGIDRIVMLATESGYGVSYRPLIVHKATLCPLSRLLAVKRDQTGSRLVFDSSVTTSQPSLKPCPSPSLPHTHTHTHTRMHARPLPTPPPTYTHTHRYDHDSINFIEQLSLA